MRLHVPGLQADLAQQDRIPASQLLTQFQLFAEELQLGQQDRGLLDVQSAVHARTQERRPM
ncbi:hypothetical protein PHLH8_56910 [Pseudomonas sp. Pc102]|nr:hypothetical protein PHLH8_56910 [Pseudomonas sp. Pc102]